MPMNDIPSLFAALRQLYQDSKPAALDALADWESATTSLTAHGTMRAWMTAHDSASVETLQIGIDPLSVWAPGPRTVNAAAATYVEFDGSRRDYAGMHVLGASPTVLAVGDNHHVIIYRLTE
jgi:hypothetical protein